MEKRPVRMLRRQAVELKTGLKRSTIYDYMRKGAFPNPIKLGGKIVVWIESEVDDWINEQIKKSRAKH